MAWFLALPTEYLIGMLLWLAAGVFAIWGLLKWRQRLRRSGRKQTPANALLSLWLFLALLTGVELYFALLFDATDSFNMSNVSQVWFRRHIKPDQQFLKLGHGGISYRDNQTFPKSVPQDKTHICFVGDSFTFGHGVSDVSDRFTNRVRAELTSHSPDEYLVTNLSAPGTDLNWADALLHELADEEIRIDTLVYVFCPNDIEVYHRDHMKNIEKLAKLNPEFPLLKHTYFFNLLYFRMKLATVPEVRDYYGYLADYYSGEPWERMQKQFEDFAAFCESHRIELKVVIFPFLQNLDEKSPFDHARKVVREFCQAHGIAVLDLHDSLESHSEENLTVSLFDAHPNARAHQLAAEAIMDFLLE